MSTERQLPYYKFPNMPSPEWAEMQQKFAEATMKLVQDHHLACEKLTENQLAELIRQMVLSGDIAVNVYDMPSTPGTITTTQHLVYIPFRESERLRGEIEAIKIRLANAAEMLKAAGVTQAAIDGVLFDYVEEGGL